jgi:hypothetical protein
MLEATTPEILARNIMTGSEWDDCLDVRRFGRRAPGGAPYDTVEAIVEGFVLMMVSDYDLPRPSQELIEDAIQILIDTADAEIEANDERDREYNRTQPGKSALPEFWSERTY